MYLFRTGIFLFLYFLMRYIGIDVAKDTLEVYCQGLSFAVDNAKAGHRQLLKQLCPGDVIGLEPTNTYHYSISNLLLTKGYTVKLVDSLLSSRYQKLTMRKQTNDKSAAKAISELLAIGKGRMLTQSEVDCPLRELTRGRHHLVIQRATLKNKLHKEHNKTLCVCYQKLIKDFDKQIGKLEAKILAAEPDGVHILTDVPGISPLSARTILAELGDIGRFRSHRQVASFAGYDPGSATSGTSVNKQGKLSKRGSPYLRHVMHHSAFANVRSDNVFGAYYRKKKAEGKHFFAANTATARKMLQIIYALLKKQEHYSGEFFRKTLPNKQEQATE